MNVIQVRVEFSVSVFINVGLAWFANRLEPLNNLSLASKQLWYQSKLHVVDGINSESIDTSLHPEVQNILHFDLDQRISVVQVRLSGEELVKVALTPSLVIRPCSRVEHGDPVIWILSNASYHWAISPDVEVFIAGRSVRRQHKPVVLVACVIWLRKFISNEIC